MSRWRSAPFNHSAYPVSCLWSAFRQLGCVGGWVGCCCMTHCVRTYPVSPLPLPFPSLDPLTHSRTHSLTHSVVLVSADHTQACTHPPSRCSALQCGLLSTGHINGGMRLKTNHSAWPPATHNDALSPQLPGYLTT